MSELFSGLSTVAVDRRRNGVVTVRLSRPDRLNALNASLVRELTDVLLALDGDAEARAVLLTGAGRGFCAGADVGLIGEIAASQVARQAEEAFAASARAVKALYGLSKPVVAAVNGPAAGAGASLAAACDFVLMAEEATIAFLFAKRGLVADWGATWLLPRLVGMAKARELCYFGEALTAAEAVACGLATRAVPGDKLLEEAHELAERLAAGPTTATGHTKRLLSRAFDHTFAEGVAAEFESQHECFVTHDALEGATAFLQRRPPVFIGR